LWGVNTLSIDFCPKKQEMNSATDARKQGRKIFRPSMGYWQSAHVILCVAVPTELPARPTHA
jgi:hypothetical protein